MESRGQPVRSTFTPRDRSWPKATLDCFRERLDSRTADTARRQHRVRSPRQLPNGRIRTARSLNRMEARAGLFASLLIAPVLRSRSLDARVFGLLVVANDFLQGTCPDCRTLPAADHERDWTQGHFRPPGIGGLHRTANIRMAPAMLPEVARRRQRSGHQRSRI